MGQGFLPAQQPAIHAQLGPMKCTVIRGHASELTPIRLELLEPVFVRIIAIRTAANVQWAVIGLKCQFSLERAGTACSNDTVTCHALGRRR